MFRLMIGGIFAILVCGVGRADVIELDRFDQVDFEDGTLDNGDQAVSGPLTITFSNITTSDGLPGAQIDEDGIYLSDDALEFAVVSMDLVFNIDVVIDAYDIDFVQFTQLNPIATFTIAGPAGISGSNDVTQSPLGIRQAFDMGTIPFFQAGETYTLTHSVTGTSNFSQIDEFDFTAVPSPGSGALIFFLLAFTAGFGRNRVL